jgi:hypothetical protein
MCDFWAVGNRPRPSCRVITHQVDVALLLLLLLQYGFNTNCTAQTVPLCVNAASGKLVFQTTNISAATTAALVM